MRDPQFTADEGGQLTATLKRESDAGELILYARYLDDKNQFITPIPLIQRGTDNFSAYPGFDPLTATYYSEAIRRVRLDGYPNGGTNADLADGRGAQMLFLGANYDHEFDNGWSISDKFLANGGDVDTNALFSGSNPATLFDELYTIPTNLGGLALPAGFGDGHLRRRRRGARRPERHPSGLVVHSQGAAEHQQRFSPEQGAVRGQHADGRPVPRLLRDGR